MIDCPYRVEESCRHIDELVGVQSSIPVETCNACISLVPNVESRKEGYVVQNLSWAKRQELGLKVGAIPTLPVKPSMQSVWRNHASRPGIADEMLEIARSTKARQNAPLMTIEESVAVCQSCRYYRGTRKEPEPKCRKWCNCTEADRADPYKQDSEPCPIHLWRHQ